MFNSKVLFRALPLALYNLSKKRDIGALVAQVTRERLEPVRLKVTDQDWSALLMLQEKHGLNRQTTVQIALLEIIENHNCYGVSKNEIDFIKKSSESKSGGMVELNADYCQR